MENESRSSEEEQSLNEFLVGLRPRLEYELLTEASARRICATLNEMFSDMIETPVEVDCGVKHIVGDGSIVGSEMLRGRDDISRSSSGLRNRGVMKRFDVLQYNDTLVSRGTSVGVTEPCLVYEEVPHKVRRVPEPETTETYVPLLRLETVTPIN